MRPRRKGTLGVGTLVVGLIIAVGLVPSVGSAAATFGSRTRVLCPGTPNSKKFCPRSTSRTEPSIKVDSAGRAWVIDQFGIPGGSALWKRNANTTDFSYVDLPEYVPTASDRTGMALGGGDVDLTIGTDNTVYTASLWAGSITVSSYSPDGTNIMRSYLSGAKPGIDRHWIASYGAKTVYLYYQSFESVRNVWLSRSDDGGQTWLPAIQMQDPVATNGVFSVQMDGNFVVDPSTGTVYAVYTDGSGLWLARCKPVPSGAGCADPSAAGGIRPTAENFLISGQGPFTTDFPIVAIDRSGNLYAAWSDRHTIWFTRSINGGQTWKARTAVNAGSTGSAVFPWITAGTSGRVGVAWLGSTRAEPESTTGGPWYAYYASSINALAVPPTFAVVQASDDEVHRADICLEGLNCGGVLAKGPEPVGELAGNRNLAEVVTVTVDNNGMAVVAYPDDYENGSTYTRTVVAQQTGGDPLIG